MAIAKPHIAFLLLLISAVSLSAQTKTDVFIYIPPITGTGSTPNDNAVIAQMLTDETEARNYTVVGSPRQSDFSLIGAIASYGSHPVTEKIDDGAWYYDDELYYDEHYFYEDMWYEEDVPIPETAHTDVAGEAYIFNLTLKNDKTNIVLAEQEVIYSSLDDLYTFFSVLMLNIFSQNLSEIRHDADAWRSKWLYAGFGAFWSPRIYYGTEQSTHFVNFGGAVTAEWHFLPFMSFEAGVEIAPDWVVASAKTDDSYRNVMLEIPFALKLVFKPSNYYMLEPYGGAHINIPLYDTTSPPLFSWMVGFQYGVKAGPGIFFIDPRFSMDFGKSSLSRGPGNELFWYQRYIIHLGIGYKFGAFSRQKP